MGKNKLIDNKMSIKLLRALIFLLIFCTVIGVMSFIKLVRAHAADNSFDYSNVLYSNIISSATFRADSTQIGETSEEDIIIIARNIGGNDLQLSEILDSYSTNYDAGDPGVLSNNHPMRFGHSCFSKSGNHDDFFYKGNGQLNPEKAEFNSDKSHMDLPSSCFLTLHPGENYSITLHVPKKTNEANVPMKSGNYGTYSVSPLRFLVTGYGSVEVSALKNAGTSKIDNMGKAEAVTCFSPLGISDYEDIVFAKNDRVECSIKIEVPTIHDSQYEIAIYKYETENEGNVTRYDRPFSDSYTGSPIQPDSTDQTYFGYDNVDAIPRSRNHHMQITAKSTALYGESAEKDTLLSFNAPDETGRYYVAVYPLGSANASDDKLLDVANYSFYVGDFTGENTDNIDLACDNGIKNTDNILTLNKKYSGQNDLFQKCHILRQRSTFVESLSTYLNVKKLGGKEPLYTLSSGIAMSAGISFDRDGISTIPIDQYSTFKDIGFDLSDFEAGDYIFDFHGNFKDDSNMQGKCSVFDGDGKVIDNKESCLSNGGFWDNIPSAFDKSIQIRVIDNDITKAKDRTTYEEASVGGNDSCKYNSHLLDAENTVLETSTEVDPNFIYCDFNNLRKTNAKENYFDIEMKFNGIELNDSLSKRIIQNSLQHINGAILTPNPNFDKYLYELVTDSAHDHKAVIQMPTKLDLCKISGKTSSNCDDEHSSGVFTFELITYDKDWNQLESKSLSFVIASSVDGMVKSQGKAFEQIMAKERTIPGSLPKSILTGDLLKNVDIAWEDFKKEATEIGAKEQGTQKWQIEGSPKIQISQTDYDNFKKSVSSLARHYDEKIFNTKNLGVDNKDVRFFDNLVWSESRACSPLGVEDQDNISNDFSCYLSHYTDRSKYFVVGFHTEISDILKDQGGVHAVLQKNVFEETKGEALSCDSLNGVDLSKQENHAINCRISNLSGQDKMYTVYLPTGSLGEITGGNVLDTGTASDIDIPAYYTYMFTFDFSSLWVTDSGYYKCNSDKFLLGDDNKCYPHSASISEDYPPYDATYVPIGHYDLSNVLIRAVSSDRKISGSYKF